MQREWWTECDTCSNTVGIVRLQCGHLYCRECRQDGFADPCSVCEMTRLSERVDTANGEE
jgi:hypothetical protein